MGVFLLSNSFGQQLPTTKADSLRDEGNLKLAIEEYSNRYKKDSTDIKNTYNYACALALDRQFEEAFYYLNIASIKDSSNYALNDPDFYFLIEDERWEKFKNRQIEKLEAKHGKLENLELSKELWTMGLVDQAFYYHTSVARKTKGSPFIPALWELKKILNKENLTRLEEIIERHGWPKKSIVGRRAANTAFLIIQHSELATQKKYLPLLKEAANNGEAKLSSLALLTDRVNLEEGNFQIYGSQIGGDPNTGEGYVFPLKDPENVDKRRAEVGLMPLEKYTSYFGIKWDLEEYKKNLPHYAQLLKESVAKGKD